MSERIAMNQAMTAPASPTAQQIIAARAAAGITQTEAAELIYASLRTWQNWEAPAGNGNARDMPPALFEYFRLLTTSRAVKRARDALPHLPSTRMMRK